ncbi:hypothetical protein niasHT_018064 [Heterodera trifolii]|uniref:ABC transporter domain-containing protein n=1 Tax=Heterodera trifolii TaxID=157864 RepID=A0ABD2LK89_9BILA
MLDTELTGDEMPVIDAAMLAFDTRREALLAEERQLQAKIIRFIWKVCIGSRSDSSLCIVGENGAGKTTLLKLLLDDHSHTSGTRSANRRLNIGYFTQHHVDQLDLDDSPLELLVQCFPGLGQSKNVFINLIDHLKTEDLLPMVVFVFSRQRCDDTAQLLQSVDLLTTEKEKKIFSEKRKKRALFNGKLFHFMEICRN